MREYEPPTTKAGRDAEALLADIEEQMPEALADLANDEAYGAFLRAVQDEVIATQGATSGLYIDMLDEAPGYWTEAWGK